MQRSIHEKPTHEPDHDTVTVRISANLERCAAAIRAVDFNQVSDFNIRRLMQAERDLHSFMKHVPE